MMKSLCKIGLKVSVWAILLLPIVGCRKHKEQPGYNQTINPLWEYYIGGTRLPIKPIIHKKSVLLTGAKDNTAESVGKLIALDKASSSLQWEWSDHFNAQYEEFDKYSLKPIYQDIMAVSIGGRNYAIDLKTGKTAWKNRNNTTTSASSLVNLGNRLFRSDIGNLMIEGHYNERIMEADFFTGNWSTVFEVTGGDSIRQGIEVPSFYFEPDGDTVMILTNTTSEPGVGIVPYLISYNKTKKITYYTVQLYENPTGFSAVDWFPVIVGERVYLAVDDILVCHNIITGERIWKRQLNSNLLFSGFTLAENRIYARSEGDGFVWCIDTETGNVIWKKPFLGTGSPIEYYNNILYFVASTKLNIMDATTGTMLATITAPSAFKNSNDFFSSCTVDPETGYIYVRSFSTVYCYPPL